MFFEHSKNVLRECSANVREAFAECFTRMLVQHSGVSTRRRFGEHSANITQMFAQHLANIIWLAGQSPLDLSSCSQRHQFVRPASVYFEVAASTRSVWRSTSASIQSSDHFQNLPRLKCLVGFYTAIDNTWRYSSVAVYVAVCVLHWRTQTATHTATEESLPPELSDLTELVEAAADKLFQLTLKDNHRPFLFSFLPPKSDNRCNLRKKHQNKESFVLTAILLFGYFTKTVTCIN